ncbi:MAG: ISAs1 family transposase [Pseudohongiellaceae bacterium]
MELFRTVFSAVRDPRKANAFHDLSELLFIALAASLCGARTCVEMAAFGRSKEPLLRGFLRLEHGVPSHDTFSRVFRLLEPEAFEAAFGRFMRSFGEAARIAAPKGVVAIDGKSLRGAYDKGQAHMPRMLVSAWGASTRMVLGSAEAPQGNEVAGALAVIELLSLKGCIVTADALHCHRAMAGAIRQAKGHYALSVKANQPALLRDAEAVLVRAGRRATQASSSTIAHGREERRQVITAAVSGLAVKHDFPGLAAVARIDAWRTVNGRTSHRIKYVLLSKPLPAGEVLDIVREHWSIENRLHWLLDLTLREDEARNRKANGPCNLAVLRRLTLNVLNAHPDKASTRVKQKKAGWDDAYLLELLTHMR